MSHYPDSFFYSYYKDDPVDKQPSCPVTDTATATSFEKAICDNKELSDKLQVYVENSKGEDERYINTSSKYNTQILDSFNLGIGVLLGAILLYKI